MIVEIEQRCDCIMIGYQDEVLTTADHDCANCHGSGVKRIFIKNVLNFRFKRDE